MGAKSFKLPEYIKKNFDKYKYVLLICLVGIILVLFPGGRNKEQQTETVQNNAMPQIEALERSLEDALSTIEGVGNTKVVLTAKSGYEEVYAYDETKSANKSEGSAASDSQKSLVLISSGGSQSPVVVKTNYPTFLGAVVICEGGDNAVVQLEVMNAIKSLTGISSDNIVITKMKK